jgi:hypothetical protein
LIVVVQRDPAAFTLESLPSSEAEFTRLARAMARPQP